MNILITVCARGGSKGVPHKNIRPLCGKPLICHTLDLIAQWQPEGTKNRDVWISTDSQTIADVATQSGFRVPQLRPPELAQDQTPKLHVLSHALKEAEKLHSKKYDIVCDLDPTAPIRTLDDLNTGLKKFHQTQPDVCFSVAPARKNPYFNMVEVKSGDWVRLVKEREQNATSRQSAPTVYEMNASVYFYQRSFLATSPTTLWQGSTSCFVMPESSAYDIDHEMDFLINETILKHLTRHK